MLNIMISKYESSNKRISEIELFRFIAALIIMSFHFQFIFRNGWILVDFFFVLSGILMAQSASRILISHELISIGQETKRFMLGKIRSLFPFLLICYITYLFLYAYQDGFSVSFINDFLNQIPNYLFLKQGGFNIDYRLAEGFTWYISAMIIGLLILFPIYIKYKDSSRFIIMPLLFIFCIGYVINNASIGVNNTWMGFISGGLLRGMGEMALGAFCYEICIRLRAINLTKVGKLLVMLLLLFLVLILLVWATGRLSGTKAFIMVFIIAMILIILYSRLISFIPSGNMFCCYLGSLSLPMYLMHLPILHFAIALGYGEWAYSNAIITEAAVIVVSMISVWFVKYVRKNDWYGKVTRALIMSRDQ